MKWVFTVSYYITEDDPGKAWKREEALKREEARKRAVALMKKNWKSQHLSLGLTRNDLKPPASRVTGANSKFPLRLFLNDVTIKLPFNFLCQKKIVFKINKQ